MNVRTCLSVEGAECQYKTQKWRKHLKEVGYGLKNLAIGRFDEKHSG